VLGLPQFFTGAFPKDNPRTAKLTELTRLVSTRRRLVFKTLPDRIGPDGSTRRALVIGLPLAHVPLWSDLPPYRVERVLFAVASVEENWE
jgi:hypothetical protein